MVVTWPTSHAAKGWLKSFARKNILCAATHSACALYQPPYTNEAAAHMHGGDLTNIPRVDVLIESECVF